jgi:hypothetical protein
MIHASGKVRTRKQRDHIRQWDNAFVSAIDKRGPTADVFFRPEEIHGASGIADILEPLPKGHRYVGHEARSLFIEESAVLEDDLEGFTAVETGKIHRHGFSREKPADRQRFKPSLTEPFLLAVDGDAVMGWKIVEGGERGDVVRPRIQPTRNTGGKQIVKRLSSLLDGESEFRCQFRVKWRLARFHHAFHDDMKGFVQSGGFLHGMILLSDFY